MPNGSKSNGLMFFFGVMAIIVLVGIFFCNANTPVKVLAQWVQVVGRTQKGCVLQPGEAVMPDTGQVPGQDPGQDYAECNYDFLARAVVPAHAPCPMATVHSADGDVTFLMNQRANPYIKGFSTINVCELRIDGSKRPASVSVESLTSVPPAPMPLSVRWVEKNGPKTVSILGDTGCRANPEQSCNWQEWPFAQLIAEQAPTSDLVTPDMVIHVGDFMYVKRDDWAAWKAEFFDPAKPLLEGAPWVMVRGNHERCGDFGDAPLGYYLFFDTADTQSLTCAEDNELTATYAVDIADDRRLIVTDSSIAFAADMTTPKAPGTAFGEMASMMDQVKALAAGAGARKVWFTTHIPVYVLEKCSGSDLATKTLSGCQTNNGSAVMRAAWFDKDMPTAGVEAILAGHQHLAQTLVPQNGIDATLQIVSGASGVNLDDPAHANDNSVSCLGPDSLGRLGMEATLTTYQSVPKPQEVTLELCSNVNFGYFLYGEFRNETTNKKEKTYRYRVLR